jgi:predicted dehydrogenase
MVNIGIVGYGYWGPNLVRNFSSVPNSKVQYVTDLRKERLELVNRHYPSLLTTTNVDDLLNDASLDAIVIATPVFLHFDLAKKALQKGKHVLIEKPMTASSAEANELIELAQKNNKALMVDHTFLYTGAVRKMKQLVESNELGKINYYDSTRINLGLFQPDVNVVWDLAPHDISILYYLIEERPVSVSATGISHLKNGIENIAYVTLNFQSNMIAHFSASWSSPVKIRKILVGGDKKMILFDDLELTEKIKVYDTGYSAKTDEDKRKILVDYRVGDIHIPKVEMKEALAGMASDFINAIMNGSEPVSNWKSGLDVVKVLEASQTSIKQNGKEVKLN